MLGALQGRGAARIALWSAVEAVPTLVFGRAIAGAIDGFLAHRPATGLGWLGALSVAALVGSYGSRRIYPVLADVVEPFRDDLVRRVVRGTLHRPDRGAVARLTHQVEIVRDTFAGMVMIVRGFVFTTIGALIGMLSLAPIVLVIVIPPLLLGVGLFLCLVRPTAARQRDLMIAEERIAESASAMTEGSRDIVACGAEDRIRADLGGEIEVQAAASRSMARLTAARVFALAVGGWLPLLLVLGLAPWLMRHGATAGAVVGSLTYVLQGLQPALASLVQGIGASGVRLVVTLTRILEAGPDLPRPPLPRPADVDAERDLELRGVGFAYGPHAERVVDDLDLSVPYGDHLAIVGPSGIGKSTLAGLMTGMLEPGAGEVRLGGREVSPSADRVLIPQEAYVFAGTLRENITYLAPDVAEAALDAGASAVGLGALAARLGGYDAQLDPAALSAGEAQLIALCRAYLSPARMVVLDEAACHLDPTAEAIAERAFAERPGTLVVIAHRISSALRARRILVLDGLSARLGSHDELLQSSALYRDLVGHWWPERDRTSQPSGLAGDANRVHTVASTGLADDPGQVVADRPH
ncbi:MAG: antibiotic transporter ATP-binding protein [Streptosporangiaceae bacterium]|nr:antibiotic transporter ATP-binding protein [Streptosporangiaceae bacterium]